MSAPMQLTAVDRALGAIRLSILTAQAMLCLEGQAGAAKRLEDMVPILTEVGVAVASLPKKEPST